MRVCTFIHSLEDTEAQASLHSKAEELAAESQLDVVPCEEDALASGVGDCPHGWVLHSTSVSVSPEQARPCPLLCLTTCLVTTFSPPPQLLLQGPATHWPSSQSETERGHD